MGALHIQNSYYDSVGVFNTLGNNNVTENYNTFALNKLNQSNMTLQTAISEINTFSVADAKRELLMLNSYNTEISELEKIVVDIKSKELKKAALKFFNYFKTIKYELEEIVVDNNLGLMMIRDLDTNKYDVINHSNGDKEIIYKSTYKKEQNKENSEDFLAQLKARINEL